MTAKIKLNAASGGGSFSIQAPSSSSNNRIFTLPDSADATLLTSSTSTGKVLNSGQAVKTDTFSTQATSFTDITGLTVTMTPASTSSKFLINYTVHFQPRDQHYSGAIRCVKVVGGVTTDDIYVGQANGSRIRSSNYCWSDNEQHSRASFRIQSGTFIHSPSTTNPVTFKLQTRLLGTYGYANDVFVIRNNTYNDGDSYGSVPSAITVLELAS